MRVKTKVVGVGEGKCPLIRVERMMELENHHLQSAKKSLI